MGHFFEEIRVAKSDPGKGEAGRTGDWRSQTPVIDQEKCAGTDSCLVCWLYCPDGVISRDFPLQIDLDHCKGCGICAEECPRKAIDMVDQTARPVARHEK